MAGKSVDLDDILEEVRRDFIETTCERLSTVDNLITDMMEGRDADSALGEFLRHIHSIKGQGGIFDFPTVTTIAHRLEDYLETAPAHSTKQFKDLQHFVDAIRKIMESGDDPEAGQAQALLASLPVTAKDFSEVAAFEGKKPIQEVQMLLVMPKGTQRKIIGKELAACGFQVSNADTPVDAIGYAVIYSPDIIIVSREMEQMTGREFACALAQIDATKDCHIVVATSAKQTVSDMPDSARMIQKGPGFIDDLTDCLGDWGFFG